LMTQALLAQKLREKLNFADKPGSGPLKVLGNGKLNSRRTKKGSIQLSPPDFLLRRSSLLSFNLSQRAIDPEQSAKLQAETGLDYDLQRDLAECRLDAETAQLLFYCYKLAVITGDNVTVLMACDYVAMVKGKLRAPGNPKDFWTPRRTRYKKHARKLSAEIRWNVRLTGDAQTKNCIDDFVQFLEKNWEIS
jgi:hypothetical protein